LIVRDAAADNLPWAVVMMMGTDRGDCIADSGAMDEGRAGVVDAAAVEGTDTDTIVKGTYLRIFWRLLAYQMSTASAKAMMMAMVCETSKSILLVPVLLLVYLNLA
jgi:hypothetical protein